MAVVNQYKFVGVDNSTSGSALSPFGSGNPLVSETYVIKSKALTANETTELLTQPLIVEGGKTFTVQSSTTDSFDVAISYLNIKKEVTS